MIARMEVKGVHLDIDTSLSKYIDRKLGRLDRFMSVHSRQSAHLEVTLHESKPSKGPKQCHCDITLYMPHETIVIKEATINMFAAVDIVETKLKIQLKKYKELHERVKLHRKMFARRKQPQIIELPE